MEVGLEVPVPSSVTSSPAMIDLSGPALTNGPGITVMAVLFEKVQLTGWVMETSSMAKSLPKEDRLRPMIDNSAVVFDPLFQL